VIAKFIDSIPTGSIGLDSGCGNGKYLSLPSDRSSNLCTIGLDRSFNLLRIARKAGGVEKDVIQGDALNVPWREGIFVCGHPTMTMI
jgi:tRNA (uracil-5-)-methyltransferase TRM9